MQPWLTISQALSVERHGSASLNSEILRPKLISDTCRVFPTKCLVQRGLSLVLGVLPSEDFYKDL